MQPGRGGTHQQGPVEQLDPAVVLRQRKVVGLGPRAVVSLERSDTRTGEVLEHTEWTEAPQQAPAPC